MAELEEFSLASSRRAAADDRLAEWVAAFLSSPGSDNEALAAALALGEAEYVGPVMLALDELTPMAGPADEEVVVPIEEETWEGDVSQMTTSLDEGWEPPPVLVSYRDGELFLEDGNHRHESMRRTGRSRVWAIVCFFNHADRDRFSKDAEGRVAGSRLLEEVARVRCDLRPRRASDRS